MLRQNFTDRRVSACLDLRAFEQERLGPLMASRGIKCAPCWTCLRRGLYWDPLGQHRLPDSRGSSSWISRSIPGSGYWQLQGPRSSDPVPGLDAAATGANRSAHRTVPGRSLGPHSHRTLRIRSGALPGRRTDQPSRAIVPNRRGHRANNRPGACTYRTGSRGSSCQLHDPLIRSKRDDFPSRKS
jgi:hypothetical protein